MFVASLGFGPQYFKGCGKVVRRVSRLRGLSSYCDFCVFVVRVYHFQEGVNGFGCKVWGRMDLGMIQGCFRIQGFSCLIIEQILMLLGSFSQASRNGEGRYICVLISFIIPLKLYKKIC